MVTAVWVAPASAARSASRCSDRVVRGRRLATVGVLLLAFAIGESAIFLRAEVTRTAAYLFGDEAYSLFVADRLLHGARLYEDVAYPYGFLPVRLYAAVASVAGNSPVVYLQCLLAISLLNLALRITLLRRVAAPTVAIFIAFAAGLPLLLIPGALVGGYTGTPYIPVERALMLAIVLAWRPPATRSRTSAIALGVLIAALQTVKFGPALAMAGAVAIGDVVVKIRDRGTVRLLLRAAALTFGAALAGELLLVVVTRATLSPEIAADVLWPSYLLQAYSGAARWPAWYGSRKFVGRDLRAPPPGVVCAGGR